MFFLLFPSFFCCEERLHIGIVILPQNKITTKMRKNTITLDKKNVEQQQAFELVAKTNTSLFITGRAGTGKTTFIKRILTEINKNFIVLAPTGIAALAVGGQTMHSFFGFPMQVIGPHTQLDLYPDKRQLLNEVDTIIVDEVSMVRSDLVDGMDRCLRMVTSSNMPFGGKQILFVGDLFQLPPVVRQGSAEADMLRDLYGAGLPFFYKANVLKRMNLPKIEFQKVYRQNDPAFLAILDKIRIGEITSEDLELLNKHVGKDEEHKDFSVTLTSFNSMADKINDKKLRGIQDEEFCYLADIDGEFKKNDAPVPELLKLKVGAQVIFCRNNPSSGYMNGTIAKVVSLTEDMIMVQLENGLKIDVKRVSWVNYRSEYNPKLRKMESCEIGSFTQYPLKLAWAITIHKSQGMTFERMHFDLSRGTFQAGQAYVAISRMRSLDGLTLSHKIMPHHITQNPEVRAFSNSFNDMTLINEELRIGKKIYKYLAKKDFNMASKICLEQVVTKAKRKDYRNAALLAKKMFDLMLSDNHLMGQTADTNMLKECNMTCSFLNSVFCLYGNRFEEAIGYADMVLSRKTCLEAIYVKGRAFLELGKIEEAYDTCYQMINTVGKSEEKKVIDKKLLLFEARVNEQIGNSNNAICKKLIDICPECIEAYVLIRKEAIKNGLSIDNEGDENNVFIQLFNDNSVSDQEFEGMVAASDLDSRDFTKFKRKIKRLAF